MRLFSLMLFLSFGICVSSASAQSIDPCKADKEEFCKDVKPGEGRVMMCLLAHKDKLSKSCTDAGKKNLKKLKKAGADCKDDTQKFCKDVEPGQGRIVMCLLANEKDLSAECKSQVKKGKKKRKSVGAACKKDVKTHCKDVKPGGGRIIQCLSENESKVSDKCKAALASD